jgi:cation diffusion facilitator family transporter
MAITDGTVGQRAYLRGSELRWAWVSLVVGAALLVIKFAAYFLTGSQAIFSDALENVTNIMTAGFAVYSIRLAHRPADMEHPYGHGKIEFFSAGLEGSMVLLAAALIAGKVVMSWLSHEQLVVHRLDVGLALMSLALLVNGVLGLSLWLRGRKNKALTLEAGGIHLIVDALDSIAVLVAIAIVRLTGWLWVDSAGALAVAVYIAILGLRLLKRSTAGLMDEQDPNERRQLQVILESHIGPSAKEPRICSFHKLRFRHSGRNCWVDFHVMVPKWWNIEQGHRVASVIEHEIEVALGEANATAHVEPCENAGCAECGGGEREMGGGENETAL